MAVLFGTSQWDKNEPDTHNLPYMKQMHEDIVALYRQVGIAKDMLPITWTRTTVNETMRTWLTQRTHAELDKIHAYTSTSEQFYREARNRHKAPSPTLPPDAPTCMQCQKAFRTIKALKMHQTAAHGYRNPLRSQVTTNQCPRCNKQFVDVNGARSHWAKQICVPEHERISGDLQPQPAQNVAPNVPNILSFFQ